MTQNFSAWQIKKVFKSFKWLHGYFLAQKYPNYKFHTENQIQFEVRQKTLKSTGANNFNVTTVNWNLNNNDMWFAFYQTKK